MAKARQRKAAKRVASSNRRVRRNGVNSADFCAAARAALKRGEPDAISDRTLQQVLAAAIKIYAAKVERRGHEVAPFPQNTVTATESVVTACGMIRAADLNMFDVAIWFHRPPGIE
ncbi:MAG: hypothetical protein WBF58_18565 [Xanthobacteraceae bacterium]